jgi:hypothetical protein
MRLQPKGIGSADISASMCGKIVPFRRCFTVLRPGDRPHRIGLHCAILGIYEACKVWTTLIRDAQRLQFAAEKQQVKRRC